MTQENNGLTAAQKDRIGNWLALAVCLLGVIFGYGFLVGSDLMMWSIVVINFVFGPACFVFYLLEVKKGIFARDDEK